MRSSQVNIPKSYSVSITPVSVAPEDMSRVDVTLRSASGDYACTFRAKAEDDGVWRVTWMVMEAGGQDNTDEIAWLETTYHYVGSR